MLDVTRLRVIDAVARTGSVTAAARDLHYSQPSVTHHLGRLEESTGAQLLQRIGRGIRLTPAGQLLADRAAEILGRIEAADAELSAHVGLTAGRVRLAGFSSAIASLVPPAVATLADRHPGLQISLTDAHPADALELLRGGKIEVAIIFRYDESEPEPDGVRLHHLLDDPMYLLSDRGTGGLASLREATWIAGCERCRGHLLALCATAGGRLAAAGRIASTVRPGAPASARTATPSRRAASSASAGSSVTPSSAATSDCIVT